MAKKAPRSENRSSVRRSKRRKHIEDDNDLPNVYMDMLQEAAAASPTLMRQDGAAVKRRRVGERTVTLHAASEAGHASESNKHESPINDVVETKPEQIAYRDFDSGGEDEDEDDVEWEDVDLNSQQETGKEKESNLELVLEPVPERKARVVRRKPVTNLERERRMTVHKLHLVCLISHVYMRNHWCNDELTQSTLKPLISPEVLSLLRVPAEKSQFQRSTSFKDGLKQAAEVWRSHFVITAQGIRRPYWMENPILNQNIKKSDDFDNVMDISDFRAAATNKTGSRDVGVQLFCALLRAVGVDCRLVCSLQVLPFSGSGGPPSGGIMKERKPSGYVSALRRQLSGPSLFSRSSSPISRAPSSLGDIIDSKYPVYWVEVYDSAYKKWVSMDPITTMTVARPRSLAPPASDHLNSLTYILAFTKNYTIRDVTRRYAKAYNAKTYPQRVESTLGGQRWMRRTLRYYRSQFLSESDRLEDAELAGREAHEPMPTNIQDFKRHPYYTLERHLKKNEVIWPKKEVGKVSAGSKAPLESIYRRKDVHIVRSANEWYRFGRTLKAGEQPLKHSVTHRSQRGRLDSTEEDENLVRTALYAVFQTETYVSPPVRNGLVPRNEYGNVDLYVPSMIPSGGVHIRHVLAAQAARILAVDCAHAVVGYRWNKMRGVAVTDGVVVASEYEEGVREVISGLEYQEEMASDLAKKNLILSMWKKWFICLEARQRVIQYYGEGEIEDVEVDDQADESESGGGFFPDDVGESPRKSLEKSFLGAESLQVENPTHLIDQVDGSDGFQRPSSIRRSFYHLVTVPSGNDGMPANKAEESSSRPMDLEISSTPNAVPVRETARRSSTEKGKMPIQQASVTVSTTTNPSYSDILPNEVAITEQEKQREASQTPSDSYSSSLISHDPEDDDVEPDWF